MKIIEINCEDCGAAFETLEDFPQKLLICPACQSKSLKITPTEREFKVCSGGCGDCSSCG